MAQASSPVWPTLQVLDLFHLMPLVAIQPDIVSFCATMSGLVAAHGSWNIQIWGTPWKQTPWEWFYQPSLWWKKGGLPGLPTEDTGGLRWFKHEHEVFQRLCCRDCRVSAFGSLLGSPVQHAVRISTAMQLGRKVPKIFHLDPLGIVIVTVMTLLATDLRFNLQDSTKTDFSFSLDPINQFHQLLRVLTQVPARKLRCGTRLWDSFLPCRRPPCSQRLWVWRSRSLPAPLGISPRDAAFGTCEKWWTMACHSHIPDLLWNLLGLVCFKNSYWRWLWDP